MARAAFQGKVVGVVGYTFSCVVVVSSGGGSREAGFLACAGMWGSWPWVKWSVWDLGFAFPHCVGA